MSDAAYRPELPELSGVRRRIMEEQGLGGTPSPAPSAPQVSSPGPVAHVPVDTDPFAGAYAPEADEQVYAPPLAPEVNPTGFTSEGRPIVANDDGTYSTERTITVMHPELNEGRPTNIPSMFGGQERPEDEAIARVLEAGGQDPETGRELPGYETLEDAVSAAEQRSTELSGFVPVDHDPFEGDALGERALAEAEVPGGLTFDDMRQAVRKQFETSGRVLGPGARAAENFVLMQMMSVAYPRLEVEKAKRIKKMIVDPLVSGATLPRDVYEGDADPLSKKSIKRAFEMTDLISGGGFVAAALRPGVSLGTGGGRITTPPISDVDKLGFYSQATRVARQLQQKKGTPDQFRAQLLKAGVKPDEIMWSGLDKFLDGRKKVTKAEVVRFLDENRVRLDRTQLGGEQHPRVAELDQRKSELDTELADLRVTERQIIDVGDRVPTTIKERRQEINKDLSEIGSEKMRIKRPDAKYERGWKTDGGENYREHLTTYVPRPKTDLFQSGHFDQKNIVLHTRLQDFETPKTNIGPEDRVVVAAREDLQTKIDAVQSRIDERRASVAAKRQEVIRRHREAEDAGEITPEEVDRIAADESKQLADEIRDSMEADIAETMDLRSQMPEAPRTTDRTLLMDELQSDWGQAGRDTGFKDPEATARTEELGKQINTKKEEHDRTLDSARAILEELDPTPSARGAPTRDPVVPNLPDEPTMEQILAGIRAIVNEGGTVSQHSRLVPTGVVEKLREIAGREGTDPQVAEKLRLAADRAERSTSELRDLQAEFTEANRSSNQFGVAKGPFVESTKKWVDLGLRTTLREAAEQGYDRLSWPMGRAVAKRYDQIGSIDSIWYRREGDDSYYVEPMGRGGERPPQTYTRDEIVGLVGESVVARMDAGEGAKKFDIMRTRDGEFQVLVNENPRGQKYADRGEAEAKMEEIRANSNSRITGLDIEAGGEGMMSFYDKIVPSAMKKLLRKMDKDARVERIPLSKTESGPVSGGDVMQEVIRDPSAPFHKELAEMPYDGFSDWWAGLSSSKRDELFDWYRRKNAPQVWSVEITDKMREKIGEGQSLFASGLPVGSAQEPTQLVPIDYDPFEEEASE